MTPRRRKSRAARRARQREAKLAWASSLLRTASEYHLFTADFQITRPSKTRLVFLDEYASE